MTSWTQTYHKPVATPIKYNYNTVYTCSQNHVFTKNGIFPNMWMTSSTSGIKRTYHSWHHFERAFPIHTFLVSMVWVLARPIIDRLPYCTHKSVLELYNCARYGMLSPLPLEASHTRASPVTTFSKMWRFPSTIIWSMTSPVDLSSTHHDLQILKVPL